MTLRAAGPTALREAARALHEGHFVLYPTESFYGAGADALDQGAVARLVAAKGRPPDRPLPLIVPHREALQRLVTAVPAHALALMERHWPGPLTLVLPARDGLPAAVVGAHGVGVRMSPHPVAHGLAVAFGGPLTATSANRTGEPPVRSAEIAAQALPGAREVLDGGPTTGGAPSTVLAVDARGVTTLLRAGAVHV